MQDLRAFASRNLRLIPFLIVVCILPLMYFGYKNQQTQTLYKKLWARFGNLLNNNKEQQWLDRNDAQVRNWNISTAKGIVPLTELLTQVFEPLNYTLDETKSETFGLIPLKSGPFQCEDVFDKTRWLIEMGNPGIKVLEMPDELKSAYLLEGYSRLAKYVVNKNTSSAADIIWRHSDVQKKIEDAKADRLWPSYGSEGKIVQQAMSRFNVRGQFGMVIGSLSPWVEAICLAYGAQVLITVEYATINETGDARIQYLHPLQLAEQWKTYVNSVDFVATFSSIEHSGLGRYGDALDPTGDLLEARKIHCVLKSGGLLFLGLPTGKDAVFFNAHRVYGILRWSMLVAGWHFEGVFRVNNQDIGDFHKFADLLERANYQHAVVVLRKI